MNIRSFTYLNSKFNYKICSKYSRYFSVFRGNRGNHLIHPFDPNIDAMKKHETIASRQNYFENVGYATFLLSDVSAMVNLPVWYALSLDIDGVKLDE